MRDCQIHGADCGREEYLPGELEQFAAEVSPVLNGKILMHAIDIVKHRRRVPSTRQLADRLGFPRSSFFRYARGERCSRPISFQSVLQQLAAFDCGRETLMPPRRRNPLFRSLLGDVVNAASVQQLLVQAAARYGFDASLILAQAQQESGFRNVTNPTTGACGVLQLLPSTAAQYGVSNCLNVAANIDAGVHYLADLLNQFGGDIAKALAAYDWGPGNLSKAIAAWGDQWLAHAPAETQNYVAKIAGITPPAPLTIDAGTGQPIEDNTPTPPATPASLPSLDLSSVPTPVLLAAAAALGAALLSEILND